MAKKQLEVKSKLTPKTEKTLPELIQEAEAIELNPKLDFNQTVKLNKIRQLIQSNVGAILGSVIKSVDKSVLQIELEPQEELTRSVQLLEQVDNIQLSPYMRHAMQWVYDEIISNGNLKVEYNDGSTQQLNYFKDRYSKLKLKNESTRLLISEILPHLTKEMFDSMMSIISMWQNEGQHLSYNSFITQLPFDTDSDNPAQHSNNLTLRLLRNKDIKVSHFDCLTFGFIPVIRYENDEQKNENEMDLSQLFAEGKTTLLPFEDFNRDLISDLQKHTINLEPSESAEILKIFSDNDLFVQLLEKLLKAIETTLKQSPEINSNIEAMIQESEDEFMEIVTDDHTQESNFQSVKARIFEGLFEISEVDEQEVTKVINQLKSVEIAYDQMELQIMSKFKGPPELDLIRGISRYQLLTIIDELESRLKQRAKSSVESSEPLIKFQYTKHLAKNQTVSSEIQELPLLDSLNNINFGDGLIDTNILNFKSVQQVLSDLNKQLGHSIEVAKSNNSKSILDTFLVIIANPNIGNRQLFIPRNRVKRFTTDSTNGIQKGDIEIDLNAKDRLFLREVDGEIKAVFMGNPDYHR
jgi:hypothetical protein